MYGYEFLYVNNMYIVLYDLYMSVYMIFIWFVICDICMF